jgi:small-conductance mechanosensitive channel
MFGSKHILVLLVIVLASGAPFSAQTQQSPALPDSAAVISFLNQSISWYRHFSVEEQLATEPRDVLFVNEDRHLADQIVRLSFDFANAEAQNLAPGAVTQNPDQADSQSHYQSLQAMAAKADQQAKQVQAEADSLKEKLDTATGKRRQSLRAAVAEVQSELELAETRRDTLRTMVEFTGSATGKGTGATTLRAQIEELERTVPAVAAAKGATGQNPEPGAKGAGAPAQPASAAATPKEPSGILGLVTELIALSRKSNSVDETIRLTNSLAQTSKDLRAPLSAILKQAVQQGDQISNQPDSTDPAVLNQQKAQLDRLSAQFKQYSAAVLPLSKQRVLLDLYQRSLASWKQTVQSEYKDDLRSLGVRLAVLAAVLIVVVALSKLWQRAIFRYVHDPKRRYQFLLLRRIVVWFLIALIVAFAFATELGSLATFAGLLTAGVAVALQNVILSIAGYFFLIGKYGIRVGDRVQVAGVTGEVVEIGLVRMHLMELGPGGSDAQPTGRVVAFSNSVVFQPTGGVFKQIPGTNYVWHEITLTLAPEGNFRAVEERLVSAVDSVYSEYRDSIERQRKHLEKTIGPMAANSLNPQSRLRLTKAGLEVVIRYPLELERASELDDRITREVLDAIEQPPKLKLVGTGAPNIQQVDQSVPAFQAGS